MSDTTQFVTTDVGRFKLDIWETNKGPSLGYVKWAVYVLIEDLEWWDKLEVSAHPVTADVAERDGFAALYRAIEARELCKTDTQEMESAKDDDYADRD